MVLSILSISDEHSFLNLFFAQAELSRSGTQSPYLAVICLLDSSWYAHAMTDTTSYRLSAKNDWLRRNLTLAAITILKRFRPRQSSVLFLTRRICVKYG